MFPMYVWLLPIFLSTYLLYSYDTLNEVSFNFLQNGLNVFKSICHSLNEKLNFASKDNAEQNIFTLNELKKYTNLEDGLYISILGQVFDVTKGAKHYEPGAPYHAFTGRDATLAFITGEFDDEGLTDDISSLSAQQVRQVNDMVQMYSQKYIYKGKLNGRYYNKDGTPTEESYKVQEMLTHAREEQSERENNQKMFPPCNVEFIAGSGTTVWCSKKSGGLERDWTGVPRMFFDSTHSQQYRCACVKLDSKEYKEFKGFIREYDNCPKTSIKCAV